MFGGLEKSERGQDSPSGRTITPEAGPVALIDGEPVSHDDLIARLGETQGGPILQEIVLERRLEREAERRGVRPTGAQIEREERLLEAALRADLGSSDGQRLVAALRASRGLGPVRYRALLRRNAMLRALVGDRVNVTPDQVELAWRIRHGERLRTRVIVVRTEQEASRLRRELASVRPELLEATFVEAAQEHSSDPTGPGGGLIEPFSPDDPAYETSVREAARSLAPGGVSPIVAVDSGFALVFLDARIPPTGVTLESARTRIADDLRVRQERLLMDDLARELLSEGRVTVFDPSVAWSWERTTDTPPAR